MVPLDGHCELQAKEWNDTFFAKASKKVNKPFTTSFARISILSGFFYIKQSTIIDAAGTSSGEMEIGL